MVHGSPVKFHVNKHFPPGQQINTLLLVSKHPCMKVEGDGLKLLQIHGIIEMGQGKPAYTIYLLDN
jgi:hypothetical protein